MALEALSALRAFGGLGVGESMWQKGRTVTKERQALNQYYEDMATEGRAGLKAARDVAKRQGLGRFIGGVGGGVLGFLGGGIAGATAGAGFGSKWGAEFGRRRTGGGVGRISRGAERLGGAPEGMFLSGRRREAGEAQKRLMEQLTGTVSAGREAVKGRALQDALTAFQVFGGPTALKDIAAKKAGWGSLFQRPDIGGMFGARTGSVDISNAAFDEGLPSHIYGDTTASIAPPTAGPAAGPKSMAASPTAARAGPWTPQFDKDIYANIPKDSPYGPSPFAFRRGPSLQDLTSGPMEYAIPGLAEESQPDWNAYLQSILER